MCRIPFLAAVLAVFLTTFTVSAETTATEECSSIQFKCTNGQCISLAWRCDGDNDCMDQSDEQECPSTTCSTSDFRCHDDGKCIPLRWKCDRANDCHDESDEDPTTCSTLVCGEDGFQCANKACISKAWRCDGENDCESGDDELHCNSTCNSSTEFTCGNGQCISNRWKCDTHPDCKDSSDEVNCPQKACGEFEFHCMSGECIQDTWFCDGDNDCTDMSDELNCTDTVKKCRKSQFQCETLNRTCIHITWACDGDYDCEDQSDEKHCNVTCSPDQFLCDGNYCLHQSMKCDGQKDCLNGSDEENCPGASKVCENDEFDCFNNGTKCIPYNKVCDGSNDCGHFEDEGKANDGSHCPDKNPCQVANGGCSQVCHLTPGGHKCSCKPGFHMKHNSTTDCEDIDECTIPGTCSQQCLNLKGSYKCSCIKGYELVAEHHCKATEGHPELFLADRTDLRRYKLETKSYTLLVGTNGNTTVHGAIAIDFHFSENMLYWTDVNQEQIMRINLNNSTIEMVVSQNVSVPDGLALDWIHNHLYWTDTGLNHIEVASLDGSKRKVLISDGLDEPRAIALDPNNAYVYWTDWGQTPKIEKCGMNGKYRKVIISKDITWPNGLTIDYVDQRLYWIDAKTHQIGSSDLEGNNRKIILRGHTYLGHPFAITVFEDYLYWSDWPSESVRRFNKFQRGEVETIAQGLNYPMDIHIYHKYRQQAYTNRCGNNNGGCEQLCLPDPISNSFTCECQTNFYVNPDNSKKCVAGPDGSLVVPVTPDNSLANTTTSPNHSYSNKTAAVDLPTTEPPTRQHDVTCLDNRMSFSIPLRGLLGNHSRTATLSDPSCHVDTARGHLMGSFNLNSCGTTVAFTNDTVIFHNVITVTSADNSAGEEGLIPIYCNYDRFATLQLSYMPVVRHVLFTEVGIGKLSFRIQQFRDASYSTAVADSQYPLRMEPNERVYIQLSLGDVLNAGTKDDIGIKVQECVASPFSNLLQAQSSSVPLIHESCPASHDVQLMTIYPEDIQRVRFSFKVVSFPNLQSQPDDSGLVYVHCRVAVCPAGECSAANGTCPDPSALHRARRSAHDSVSAYQLSTGPFLVSEDKGGAVSSTTVLAAVSVAVAAIATVVAMVAVVAWRRSRREVIGQKF